MRTTETLPAAVLATKASLLSGVSAMLCGSSPTEILAMTTFLSVRITDTLSSAGLTTHTRRPSRDKAIGLE